MARQNDRSLRDLLTIAVLVCIALVVANYGCASDTTDPPGPVVSDDGGELPLCTGAKTDSPENCRLPDAGVPEEDTGSPPSDQGTVESPDSEVPPADTGTAQCPPAPEPYGVGAYCPAQDCILWQDPSRDCRWFCGLGPDGHVEPYRLYGRKGEQLPFVCDGDAA